MEDEFEDLVSEAIATLPREFRERLRNVDVIVQDEPTAEQMQAARVPRGHILFGLYQGVPLTVRNGMTPLFPDRVTIFRGPLLRRYSDPETIRAEVRHTVIHEIAHFFGISDDRLRELGAY